MKGERRGVRLGIETAGPATVHRGPEIRKGSLLGNILLKRYLASTKWLEKTDNAAMTGRFEELSELFEAYAGRYELGWMILIAQGYQESA